MHKKSCQYIPVLQSYLSKGPQRRIYVTCREILLGVNWGPIGSLSFKLHVLLLTGNLFRTFLFYTDKNSCLYAISE